METEDKTTTEQIETLQRLGQGAVAWLLDRSPRTVRDAHELRRAADGSYNTRDVLTWVARRWPRPKLDDDEYEKLLLLAENVHDAEHHAAALVRIVGELRQRHGDGVAVELLDLLLADWQGYVDLERLEESPAMLRQREQQAREQEQQKEADRDLRQATICHRCKKLRQGRRWLRSAPPAGFVTLQGTCPSCQ